MFYYIKKRVLRTVSNDTLQVHTLSTHVLHT